MNFISRLKEVIKRVFSKSEIQKAYGFDCALSSTMANKIDNWQAMYAGNAPWLDDKIKSLHLESAITREFSNTVLGEMSVKISNSKLENIFNNATKNLNLNFQNGLASGAMVIKPLPNNSVQYIPQTAFIPIEYDVNGRLIKVIFPEVKQISDNNFLVRLEYHNLDYMHGLTITNRAFKSSDGVHLNGEIPLNSVAEWANLQPQIYFPKMLRPAFGYYVNPIANTIDGSHAGISIFENAVDLIQLADTQFSRLDYEFSSAKRRLIIDEMAVKFNGNTDKKEVKDLVLTLPIDGGNQDFFKEFSPILREQNFINGLDEYKRQIEFAVGLSYGDISNPQSIDKTATEIKSSKQRKYATITAIQQNLKTCLEDLAYSLAFYNSLATSNYDIAINFEDSILTTDEEQRQRDLQDLQAGILRPEEYRAKWYGESLEEALKNLPQSGEVLE